MNPGRFKHRIRVEEFVEGTNDNGYPIEDWQEKYSLWCAIKTVKGQEKIIASKEVNANTYRFIIRYRKGIHHKQRIIFNERVFGIENILNDDELKKTITIVATEKNEVD